MLNHAVRAYLPAFEDHLRLSVLGRKPLAKSGTSSNVSREGDELRSPTTDRLMRTFIDAWRMGDEDGQKALLDKIARSWRADNAVGGVPVHAHLPLPSGFASIVAELLRSRPNAVASVIGKDLDPSIRMLMDQQIKGLSKDKDLEGQHLLDIASDEADRGVDWLGPTERRNGGVAEERAAKLLKLFENERTGGAWIGGVPSGTPAAQMRPDRRGRVLEEVDAPGDPNSDGRGRTMEYVEERDRRAGVRLLPWDGKGGDVLPLQGAPNPEPIVKRSRRYATPGRTERRWRVKMRTPRRSRARRISGSANLLKPSKGIARSPATRILCCASFFGVSSATFRTAAARRRRSAATSRKKRSMPRRIWQPMIRTWTGSSFTRTSRARTSRMSRGS